MLSEVTFSTFVGILSLLLALIFGKKVKGRELTDLEEMSSIFFLSMGITFLLPLILILLSNLGILESLR